MWGELRRLESGDLAAAKTALFGAHGDALIDLMGKLASHLSPEADPKVVRLAADLGWLASIDPPKASPIGFKVGDSCREYRMWKARDRRLHEEDRLEVMRRPTFEGKRVAELGCGFGCSLLSLQGVAKEVVGVEIEPIYVQLSPIFAEREGLEPPRIVEASANQSRLSDAAYDVVLNLGALQYMPIEEVLLETARILAPGGIAVMILGTFAGYLENAPRRWRRTSWRGRARDVVTITGMVTYPYVGRLFTRPFDPVHPTRRRMARWLEDVGLELVRERTVKIDHETCFVAKKG